MASFFLPVVLLIFAMLLLGIFSNTSIKVRPSGSDTSLLVVKQILWVQIPRVTSGNYALPHGCNYQPTSQTSNSCTYLGTKHPKTIKAIKGPAPWKKLTTGPKNPAVQRPYQSRLKRPKGLAPQTINNNPFHRYDVQEKSTMLGFNHSGRKTTAQNSSNNFHYRYDLHSTWPGFLHHSGPESTDHSTTNHFYFHSEAQNKPTTPKTTQITHGLFESHWPNHSDGPSSPSSHTTSEELDREITIHHPSRKQTSHNILIHPQTPRLNLIHIPTRTTAIRNSYVVKCNGYPAMQ